MAYKISKTRLWSSYILQGIVAFFLFIGAVNNLIKTETALENAAALGYPESALVPMAIALIIGLCCYVIPKTSVLGALILTGWFGGAVATHIIHGDSFVILLTPILFAILVWLAIGLRDKNVQAVLFLNKLHI